MAFSQRDSWHSAKEIRVLVSTSDATLSRFFPSPIFGERVTPIYGSLAFGSNNSAAAGGLPYSGTFRLHPVFFPKMQNAK